MNVSSNDDWRELGRIVRLQIQRGSLKLGPRGDRDRYYDPAPLLPLDALYIAPDGAAADPAGATLDVHNARHPDSKNAAGKNDVSFGFTGHYAAMRARYGAHLTDGIAGENILVACDGPLTLADLAGGLLILGADGRRLELGNVLVAHPCVEFSRFALADPQAPATLVSETLKFLDAGLRGFYAGAESEEPARVEVGDRVYARHL